MPKLYIAFHDNGVVRDIATEPLEGYLPAPSKATSSLALRYALQDGKAVERFAGKTDEEVLALIAAEQAARTSQGPAPEKTITKLAFMNRFTMEELAAIYTAAKTEVLVEVAEGVKIRVVKSALSDGRSKGEPVPANANTPS